MQSDQVSRGQRLGPLRLIPKSVSLCLGTRIHYLAPGYDLYAGSAPLPCHAGISSIRQASESPPVTETSEAVPTPCPATCMLALFCMG